MWINNYDDPEEMTLEEALELLKQNGYKDVTYEANKQNKTNTAYVFLHPYSEGVYYCDEDSEVIELAISEGLEYVEPHIATV